VAEWAGIEWRLPPELGGGMKRNQVALSNGIGWRLAPEYATGGKNKLADLCLHLQSVKNVNLKFQ